MQRNYLIFCMNEINDKKCLSCGTTENLEKRRYCSVACRQRLHYQLDVRSGLLKALNTRYATFYFTEGEIILDIMSSDSNDIFSFIFSRKPGNSPADDFILMSNRLGNAWWSEKQKTEKRYLANQRILTRAQKNKGSHHRISPGECLSPTLVSNSLMCLKLNKADLNSPDVVQTIKTAFRNMAKKHHPDQGGTVSNFRKI